MKVSINNLSKTWLKPDTVSIAIGIASAFSGILGIITRFFASGLGIAIIVVGIFFIVRRLLNYVINRKRESFGIQTNYYSARQVKWARISKKASYALWLVPLIALVNAAISTRACLDNGKLGIVISSFAAAEQDDFSYKLFHVLSADIDDADTIALMRDERFIDVGKENYMKAIETGLSQHCFGKGLFVFGKRNPTSQMFDCNIYVEKMPAILQKHLASSKNGILYLQNPAVMNFSIDNEAQAVSKFIMGLLFYNAQDYDRVSTEINLALQKQDTSQNRFKSYCRLFLGNSLLMKGKTTEAVKVFREGISSDETDAYLHYNLATTYMFMDDSASAREEYAQAARLNHQFTNPLRDVELVQTQVEEITPDTAIGTKSVALQQVTGPVLKKELPKQEVEDSDPPAREYTIIVFREKYGIVNQAGDTIVPMKYDNIDDNAFILDGRHYFLVELNNKYGALKENGKEEVPVVHPSEEYVKYILKIQHAVMKEDKSINYDY
jgi:tetratricopeptide (TPR) repeat protein